MTRPNESFLVLEVFMMRYLTTELLDYSPTAAPNENWPRQTTHDSIVLNAITLVVTTEQIEVSSDGHLHDIAGQP